MRLSVRMNILNLAVLLVLLERGNNVGWINFDITEIYPCSEKCASIYVEA